MDVGVLLWRVNKSEGSEGISHATAVQITSKKQGISSALIALKEN